VYFYNPDCVLLEFALNDAFCGFSPELFGRNIQEMIAGIRNTTEAEIVLVTAVWLDDPTSYDFVEKSFYGKLEEMAQKFGLAVARVHDHWRLQVTSGAVEFQELVQFDGVHPTVVGYKLMAEAVMDAWKKGTVPFFHPNSQNETEWPVLDIYLHIFHTGCTPRSPYSLSAP